ncbi:MAG: UDP-N-acetylmuramate--L-alanine ligase [Capnocytophaga sp.]|nr:UDP-N-acetylmuramate--L-alanine ligase [Capnocytophaga sp.]
MDFSHIKAIYFIGIGGIGMSALARYFRQAGKQVHGYDKTPSEITDVLQAEGIGVHFEDSVSQIPADFCDSGQTLVVYTPAVPQSHTEMKYFKENGFRLLKRSQVLGAITRNSRSLAVAGTHGKTTTSSILAHILVESGASVSAFLGGVAENFDSNLVLNGSEWTVAEADEFDRSFLQLSPDIACVTSMDADHLDIYGDASSLEEGFRDFARCLKPGGALLVRYNLDLQGETYGLEAGAEYRFENVRVVNEAYRFDFVFGGKRYENYEFPKPGRHNLLNALAAVSMAVKAGFEPGRLLSALATFKGVKRRFSYVIRRDDLIFIDDYAHHPTEINALFQAVDEMFPEREKTIVFQPHLFSRTRDFLDGFAESLSQFDNVLLLAIYPARELPIEGISSGLLLGKITAKNKSLVTKENLVEVVKGMNPSLLLTVGAGDIGAEVERIKRALA